MERKAGKNRVTQRRLTAVLIGLCAAAGCYAQPLLFLLPAFLALTLYWEKSCGYIAYGVCVLSFALMGCIIGRQALYAAACALPAALWLSWCFKRGRSYRGALTGCTVCFVAARYAAWCLPSLLAGEDMFAAMREVVGVVSASYSEMASALSYPLPEGFAAILVDMTPQITVAILLAPALFYAFVDVLLARRLALVSGAALRPMAPVRDWRLSRDSLIGAGILVAGGIAVHFMALENAGAIIWAIEIILVAEFGLNGFCYTVFVNQVVRRRGMGGMVLQYALYAVFLPYSLLVLAVTGLADCVLDLRGRFAGAGQGPEG